MARIRSIHPDALPRHSSETRYLYVIGEEGSRDLVKIGRADHPAWRMSTLQAGNSRRLILLRAWEGDRAAIIAVEAALHKHFSMQRVGFEWFRVSLDAIDAEMEGLL